MDRTLLPQKQGKHSCVSSDTVSRDIFHFTHPKLLATACPRGGEGREGGGGERERERETKHLGKTSLMKKKQQQ